MATSAITRLETNCEGMRLMGVHQNDEVAFGFTFKMGEGVTVHRQDGESYLGQRVKAVEDIDELGANVAVSLAALSLYDLPKRCEAEAFDGSDLPSSKHAYLEKVVKEEFNGFDAERGQLIWDNWGREVVSGFVIDPIFERDIELSTILSEELRMPGGTYECKLKLIKASGSSKELTLSRTKTVGGMPQLSKTEG